MARLASKKAARLPGRESSVCAQEREPEAALAGEQREGYPGENELTAGRRSRDLLSAQLVAAPQRNEQICPLGRYDGCEGPVACHDGGKHGLAPSVQEPHGDVRQQLLAGILSAIAVSIGEEGAGG